MYTIIIFSIYIILILTVGFILEYSQQLRKKLASEIKLKNYLLKRN